MKIALHTVSYAGVWPGQVVLTQEEIIDKAAALGYDGVMLMAKRPHASLLDMTELRRRQLRGRLEDNGLELDIIAGYNDFCGGWATPDVPLREYQVYIIGELARLARDLGGDKVRVFTGFENPNASFNEQWIWCVQGLKEAARRAADMGVTLCVQNHHDIAAHYSSLVELLVEIDEPNCKAAFDAWAPALHGDDLVAAARALAPYIAHTTIADYVRRPRFAYQPRLINYQRGDDIVRAVPMGEGFIDYCAFLNELRAGGYNGYVVYEMCSVLEGGGSEANLDRCARQFVQWMKEKGFSK